MGGGGHLLEVTSVFDTGESVSFFFMSYQYKEFSFDKEGVCVLTREYVFFACFKIFMTSPIAVMPIDIRISYF